MPETECHVDPRVARSRERILSAATELLREGGATALTVEAVAARTGIAKTTIYRQFCDRDELHLAVLNCLARAEAIPHDGTLEADVRSWMHSFAATLRAERGVVASMVDAAERSPHVEQLAREFGAGRRASLMRRLQQGADEGQLRPGVDLEILTATLVGPLVFRRYLSRQPIGRGFVDRLVDAVLGPVLTPAR